MAERYWKWIKPERLGGGGQAQTFLVVEEGAEDKGQFVLKRLNSNRIERHRNEVEACLKLSHANIAKIVDSDLTSPKPYLVMEYCKGGDLENSGIHQLEVIERQKIFAQICHGVGHAHSNGVIHRDLKPANIFLHEDNITPVIGDFGICFLTDSDDRHTELDEVAGPRWYAAPEFEDGRLDDIKPSSDVYSLGKLLYWMLARRVFAREKHRDPQFDLTKNSNDTAILLAYKLLDKCIELTTAKRFKDGAELANEVDLIVRRIVANVNIVDLNAPQHCIYCGLGEYKKVLDPSLPRTQIQPEWQDFFVMPRTAQDDRFKRETRMILECNYCGNIQIFRDRKGTWK